MPCSKMAFTPSKAPSLRPIWQTARCHSTQQVYRWQQWGRVGLTRAQIFDPGKTKIDTFGKKKSCWINNKNEVQQVTVLDTVPHKTEYCNVYIHSYISTWVLLVVKLMGPQFSLALIGSSEPGPWGLCMVLVLIGSRQFAPTFLQRLTAHERPGHIDFKTQSDTNLFNLTLLPTDALFMWPLICWLSHN